MKFNKKKLDYLIVPRTRSRRQSLPLETQVLASLLSLLRNSESVEAELSIKYLKITSKTKKMKNLRHWKDYKQKFKSVRNLLLRNSSVTSQRVHPKLKVKKNMLSKFSLLKSTVRLKNPRWKL